MLLGDPESSARSLLSMGVTSAELQPRPQQRTLVVSPYIGQPHHPSPGKSVLILLLVLLLH